MENKIIKEIDGLIKHYIEVEILERTGVSNDFNGKIYRSILKNLEKLKGEIKKCLKE